MTRTIFGTDGIRGTANTGAMTPAAILRVAMSIAQQFQNGTHRHKVIIGKDTRLSGYMVEPALTAGFISMGMDVVLVGPLPTPGVAMLTRSLRADLGVMISASHNPYADNGVKFFGPDGYKLSDAIEAEIEARLQTDLMNDLPTGDALGRARRLDDESGRYIEHVKATFPRGLRLDGLKIVVDCANGAAYKVAPKVLWELGAEVVPVAVTPDGVNINKSCGATCTKTMQEAVREHGADVGIALDGDADRVIMCDEKGRVIDGDQILALIAQDWQRAGLLRGDVVATVMSNLGLERFLKNLDLNLRRMPVGDRYVVDHMRSNDCNLGGEQSGHVILGDYGTTGDGLVAALQVLAVIRQSDKPVSETCRAFEPLPQLLRNVRCESEVCLESDPVRTAMQAAEKKLNGGGRVLVRKSGTEPLVRVMAEGDDDALVTDVVDTLCTVISDVAQKNAA